MDGPSKPPNIAPGWVAQRLKALQEASPSSTTQRRSTSRTKNTNARNASGAEREPSVAQAKESAPDDIPRHATELSTTKLSPRQDQRSASHSGGSTETTTRGRPSARPSFTKTRSSDNLDEALEDIRTKLHSVQKIIRRERSGSSEARDELLDDLGSMLDSAIATTLTPLNTPMLGARPASRIRGTSSSPAKQSHSASLLPRSQIIKQIDPLHVRLSSRPVLPGDMSPSALRTEAPTRAQSPEVSRTSTSAAPSLHLDNLRDRQIFEPVNRFTRPPNFPLTSPVRERTLLWESMSRAAISEEDSIQCPHFVTRHDVLSPKSHSPIKTPVEVPPVPLAFPQLIDTEVQAESSHHVDSGQSEDKEDDGVPIMSPRDDTRKTSPHFADRLTVVSSSTTTVQETPSVAKASEHDEHGHRKSLVKDKIKDLLTSTGRSGSIDHNGPSHIDRVGTSSIHLGELKKGVGDLDGDEARYLPHLQAPLDDSQNLYSTDGGHSLSQPRRTSTNGAATGASSSKIVSRKPTFNHKFTFPTEKRTSSPVKSTPSTPVRGRSQGAHSPGGRPYSIDRRFTLSPSRSNSRGSRGSLTFNIKARVSPGRKFGENDDTELFVTAQIESDTSDQSE